MHHLPQVDGLGDSAASCRTAARILAAFANCRINRMVSIHRESWLKSSQKRNSAVCHKRLHMFTPHIRHNVVYVIVLGSTGSRRRRPKKGHCIVQGKSLIQKLSVRVSGSRRLGCLVLPGSRRLQVDLDESRYPPSQGRPGIQIRRMLPGAPRTLPFSNNPLVILAILREHFNVTTVSDNRTTRA